MKYWEENRECMSREDLEQLQLERLQIFVVVERGVGKPKGDVEGGADVGRIILVGLFLHGSRKRIQSTQYRRLVTPHRRPRHYERKG